MARKSSDGKRLPCRRMQFDSAQGEHFKRSRTMPQDLKQVLAFLLAVFLVAVSILLAALVVASVGVLMLACQWLKFLFMA